VARLHVVALGAKLPDWAEAACAEYQKRMPKGYQVDRLDAVPRKGRIVALDERGEDLTTERFAGLLKSAAVFVIGGPDGLPEEVRAKADRLLKLSSLTLPHALAQVVLMEQIYRAATLLTGHPYHRG
jgi:23S rRNA (pseudouridine1915-N3)-methyltransferase